MEEKDKDFANKYKRKLDEPVKEKQPKRQKMSHTKSKSDKVPQPDLSTQTVDRMIESPTRGVSSAATEKSQLGQCSQSFNDHVPESPSPTERAVMIEAVPRIGYSAVVTPSTQSGSTLPDFYDSMSPLLSTEEDDFIHQIVNDITCSDNSNNNIPPISSANDYSVTETVSSNVANFNTAPTFTTLQPVPAEILNTLPGGANLRHMGQGLGGLHFTPPQPQMTVNEWQKSVSDTLSTLLFNQQAILNELKTIKVNLNGTTSLVPTVTNQACESGEQAPLSVMETVTIIPPSSEQQNPALMPIATSLDLTPDQLEKLKEKELKKNHSPAHLAVAIMNAITTAEQRMGRRVMGTKYRPALGADIVSKIQRYYFSVYPCGENDNEKNIWKQYEQPAKKVQQSLE